MVTEEHNHHHRHGHHHDHQHDGTIATDSLLERNRAHWNQSAATYNSKHTQQEFGDLINKVTTFILANISWIGVDFLDPAAHFEGKTPQERPSAVRVLDYACGPGTITAILAGRASEFVGVDFSEKMVEEYNKRFDDEASQEHINAHATVGNLFAQEGPAEALSGPKFQNFDLVVVGLGFHHFENLEQVTARLAERVKPGGTLMIVDFLPHEKNDLGDDTVHIIAHNGFTEDRVRELFMAAGLTNFGLRIMDEEVMLRGKAHRRVFLARGQKPE